ncbi:MAG: tetratricopeptide repeat protein [Deltaproteobacteria bacterium]|nr:tetratricopeptide repeat protein [Deltaproteobacteria bacterium]
MKIDRTNGYSAIAAAIICLLVFLRALTCDFINWDDPLYITENPAIRMLDWQFIRESFTVSYMGWWMPLTWISFAVDYFFWGLNPLGYHLTNILLHAVNTGLVVLIADGILQGQGSRTLKGKGQGESEGTGCRVQGKYVYSASLLLAGLLWGIHPLRVESVAWVTERKDVLNGFFSLGCVLLYIMYVLGKNRGERGISVVSPYILSLCAMFLSRAAKPICVVIPAMLLVLDWYPLGRLKQGRIKECLLDKIPYAVVAAGTALATLHLAGGESILVSFADFPVHRRLILAGNSIFEYLKMTIYPVGLTNLYLLPRAFPLSYYLGAASTVAIIIGCAVCRKDRPWFLSVLLLFLLPLVPVLGFFQNGAQAYADRFTYLPGVALSIGMAVAATKAIASKNEFVQRFSSLVAILILAGYCAMSFYLIGAWKTPETLWTRVIKIQPVGRAYYLRAEYRMRTGQYLDAAEDLVVSIRMGKNAGYPGVFNLLALRGDALLKAGRFAEAVTELGQAILLKPHHSYYYHRGLALQALGRYKEAEVDFLYAGDNTGPIVWQEFQ